MKKILTAIITIAIISTMLVSLGIAALPSEWVTAVPDAFTVNSDGSVTIKSTGNIGAQLDKEISGDFTLEFQINAPAVIANTDQKGVVAVMCPAGDWLGGYWFRITADYVQFNDGTNNTYASIEPTAPTINKNGSMNNVKIECVSNKLKYTVNGTVVAENIQPAVTTGKFICIGANYAIVAPATEADLTESIKIQNMKLTVGSETFKYFTVGTDSSTTSNIDTADSTVNFAVIAMLLTLIGFVIVFKAKKA